MYKDKDKQKQANKAANKRYRDKQKGITAQGNTEGITEQIPEISDTLRDTASPQPAQSTNSDKVIPNHVDKVILAAFGVDQPRTASLQDYTGCVEDPDLGKAVTEDLGQAVTAVAQPTTAAPVDEVEVEA